MAEVVLDANVLVGYLDANDSQHARARALIERLEADGHESVLLDVLVAWEQIYHQFGLTRPLHKDRGGKKREQESWHIDETGKDIALDHDDDD